MSASRQESGWELQEQHQYHEYRQQATVISQSTSTSSHDATSNQHQHHDSLEIEPAPRTTGQGLGIQQHNHYIEMPKESPTWASNASSTTIGMATSPGVPRWPFEETEEIGNGNRPPTNGSAHHQKPRSPPRPPPQLLQPQPSHHVHVLRYWALEITTVIVAALLMGAIVGLLAYYDGRFMPEWPFEINLNSAIAFLSTFLRAAILAAVAEIIGQIKWTWFTERTRPLHHLQDFDSASRSVLGSLRLLAVVAWNWSFTSAGLLGICAALVTIASLAVGPFTQQAIKTVTCPQLMKNARSSIPAANYVPGTSGYYRVGAGMYELEVDMKSAMIQGLTDPQGKDSDVTVTCSTGNCTWPDYGTGVTHSTIGMCSSCLETTDWVSAPDFGGNLTLPDEGAYINFDSGGENMWVGYSNLSAYSQLFSEDFATAAAVSVANFSVLLTSTSPCTKDATTGKLTCPHKISQSNLSYYDGLADYVAASCILYPCVKQYHISYQDNILNETLVNTQAAVPNTQETTEYTMYYNYTASVNPCVLDNGTWYSPANQSEAAHVPGRTWANLTVSDSFHDNQAINISVPNACLYKMDGVYFSAISNFVSNTMLSANCYYDSSQSGHLNCGDAWWLTPLWLDMNATFSTIEHTISDFARVVTNKFRMTGAGPDLKIGDSVTREEVWGLVYESSTCTEFDKRWVSLPIILVVICAVLLAWIITKNYRDPDQPVWKGSILPLLFYGLHAPGGNGSGAVHNRTVRSSSSASASMVVGPGLAGVRRGDDGLSVYDKERMERAATFVRDNGRAAPELDRIQDEAGRLWVRFHGGTEPGFMDLGSSRNIAKNADRSRMGDAEASLENLVQVNDGNRRDSMWPEFKMSSRPFRRSGSTVTTTTARRDSL